MLALPLIESFLNSMFTEGQDMALWVSEDIYSILANDFTPESLNDYLQIEVVCWKCPKPYTMMFASKPRSLTEKEVLLLVN